MPQSKILVDTNAYLRLAQTIRPLLSMPFGDNEYCLYILPELNKELGVHKLQNNFSWVTEDEYALNRQHFPNIGKKQKKAIAQTFEFLWDHVQTELPGPSRVDALYIAYAIELDIPVVTDDRDMTKLAVVFEAKVMPSLELLKIMLDCGHTNIKTINGLCDYWRTFGSGDRPANLEADFRRLFSEQ